MNIIVWIVQGVLAAVHLGAGLAKLTQTREALVANPNMAWATDFTEPVIKMIGVLEVLAAIGLIVPWWTGIAPVLTPIAALGLVALMIGAVITHTRRHETKIVPVPLFLALLAAFVAWQRFGDL
ncbi:putative integral membrane protein [Alloactinosynnema sp. L-07]|uniref:DoxX family protein n=1 Tax=Alloactinosynnema sp. L-07 TaxID=1653480 RepID=UPI00065F05C4|nr:DoxX family protein [Alloactinosynnema sp. L-07]CRK56347.1 putative integral membrane protein [Alloactinosynnema sp. L-07]